MICTEAFCHDFGEIFPQRKVPGKLNITYVEKKRFREVWESKTVLRWEKKKKKKWKFRKFWTKKAVITVV